MDRSVLTSVQCTDH